ncbi:MAG: hypothetical protein H3C55_08690 [Pseudorhodoplanes sp.]|nr:hypothetical protein [Pseudorhodoplanes sp.]
MRKLLTTSIAVAAIVVMAQHADAQDAAAGAATGGRPSAQASVLPLAVRWARRLVPAWAGPLARALAIPIAFVPRGG